MKRIDEALKTYDEVKKHGVLSDIEVTAVAALKTMKWVEEGNNMSPFSGAHSISTDTVMGKFTAYLRDNK